MSPAPLSRRSLFATGSALAVTAALPALAEPTAAPAVMDSAVPIAPPGASIEPTPIEDPVIALAERAMKTWDDLGEAIGAFSPFEEKVFEWKASNPKPQYKVGPVDVTERDPKTGEVFIRFRRDPAPEELAQIAANKKAVKNWKRRKRAFERRCGFAAAEANMEEVGRLHNAAEEALWGATPRTWEGLVAKARAARHCGQNDTLFQEINFDIGVMAGECEPVGKDDDGEA